MLKHLWTFRLLTFLFLTTFTVVYAQERSQATLMHSGIKEMLPDDEPRRAPVDPHQVLERFIKAETRVRESLNQHTFRRDVVLQTIGANGEVTGDYIRKSQFVFDDRGNRIERVLFHPAPTLKKMKITKEDIQDLAGGQLLGIDITEASKYQLNFIGPEIQGGRPVFAIDVTPRTAPNPHKMRERFFVGRVWADANTLQVVKLRGKVEPQGKQRFPLFETLRASRLGDSLFPSRTEADDILQFPHLSVHYRVQVKYYDYKLFASKLTIKEIDDSGAGPDSSSIEEAKPSDGEKVTCTTNRTAPPIGIYSWPPDATIRVFFMRGMFTAEQRRTLFTAMQNWSTGAKRIGAGVSFVDAGDSDLRVSCKLCLTIARTEQHFKRLKYLAVFLPVSYDRNQFLESAWIELDDATTDTKALRGFMAHELGHTLGLDNCPTCKKKQSIMNSFPSINRNNGVTSPTPCDLEIVRRVYDEHRRLRRTSESFAGIQSDR